MKKRKYYVECGPYRLTIAAQSGTEACCILLSGVIGREEDDEDDPGEFELSPITIVSEAGFDKDIEEFAEESVQDSQRLLPTTRILRKIGATGLAEEMEKWIEDTFDSQAKFVMKVISEDGDEV